MSPADKAERLECDSQVAKLHDEASQDNSTGRGDIDDVVDHHWIAFVCDGKGRWFELDGVQRRACTAWYNYHT